MTPWPNLLIFAINEMDSVEEPIYEEEIAVIERSIGMWCQAKNYI